ncbi:MAG TPA: hypothetical protein VF681_00355 [Abditibacteriaceae bacterium]|jgi:hypothetical protein
MKFIKSLVGMVAEANAAAARDSVNGIPSNVIAMLVFLVLGGGCGDMAFNENKPLAILGFVPFTLAFVFLLVSTLKRNTFFVRECSAFPAMPAETDADAFSVPLGFTGKLRLDAKCERRFLNVPARAAHLEAGELVFISNIDASTRFYTVVTKSRVGLWLSLPDLQSATFEEGMLLYGKTPMPALRVRYQETSGAQPKNAIAVLSFASAAERATVNLFLQSQRGAEAPLPSLTPSLVSSNI